MEAAASSSAHPPPPPTNPMVHSAYEVRDGPLPDLHEEARAGSDKAVTALLAAGAPVNAATDWGDTALHWTAVGGHVRVMRQVLEAGSNRLSRADLHRTPIFYASR